MNKAAILAVLISFTAGASAAQEEVPFETSAGSGGDGNSASRPVNYQADVNLKKVVKDDAISVDLHEALLREFEGSRSLEVVVDESDRVMQVVAPSRMTVVPDAKKGDRLTITFEVSPVRTSPESYTAACPVKRLEECARAVVRRTESIARVHAPR